MRKKKPLLPPQKRDSYWALKLPEPKINPFPKFWHPSPFPLWMESNRSWLNSLAFGVPSQNGKKAKNSFSPWPLYPPPFSRIQFLKIQNQNQIVVFASNNPKRFRKQYRGRIKEIFYRGNHICFGRNALQALEPGSHLDK